MDKIHYCYTMESEEEPKRLDLKTDPQVLKDQALWAGIRPGMRVGDLGCGPGKTTFYLNELLKPSGSVVGIDLSPQRIKYAKEHYNKEGITFIEHDLLDPLDEFGKFDLLWMRFVLEHNRTRGLDMIKNVSSILKPGGILCIVDLDHNCLSHYGLSKRLENSLFSIMDHLIEKTEFDPYAGRKLYSFLYDTGFKDIELKCYSHHLIYGELNNIDEFNWVKKIEVAAKNSGYGFDEFTKGYDGFKEEMLQFFKNPRRFSYTPGIMCKGYKPLDS